MKRWWVEGHLGKDLDKPESDEGRVRGANPRSHSISQGVKRSCILRDASLRRDWEDFQEPSFHPQYSLRRSEEPQVLQSKLKRIQWDLEKWIRRKGSTLRGTYATRPWDYSSCTPKICEMVWEICLGSRTQQQSAARLAFEVKGCIQEDDTREHSSGHLWFHHLL